MKVFVVGPKRAMIDDRYVGIRGYHTTNSHTLRFSDYLEEWCVENQFSRYHIYYNGCIDFDMDDDMLYFVCVEFSNDRDMALFLLKWSS